MGSEQRQENSRTSLKTLTATYDGSVHGRVLGRGALRFTVTDDHNHTFTGRVIDLVGTRFTVRADDGTVYRDIKSAWVDDYEVV